jgi:hypothetical protein
MVFWVLPALPRVFHQGHVKYNLYWVWAKETIEKEVMHAKIRDNSQEKHPAKKQKKTVCKDILSTKSLDTCCLHSWFME